MTTKVQSMGDLKPAYVVVSEHQALLDEVIARIKARVSEEADLNLNLDEFDAQDSAPDDVVAAASVLPFLADKRVVVVKNAQRWNDKQLDVIAGYLESAAPETCLIVAHRDKEPGRNKDWKLPALGRRSSELYKVSKAQNFLMERGGPRWPSDYPEWVITRSREVGLSIEPAAAAYLVEAAGRDLVALMQEIDKLALVYQGGAELDLEAVEAMVAPYDRAGLYEYLDAVFAGRLARALADLETLTLDRDPTAVLAGLSDRLRDLIRVSALKARGTKRADMLRELQIPKRQDWKLKKQLEMAKRYDVKTLVRFFELAAEAEEMVKSGRLDAALGLEMLTVRIARAASTR